MRVLLITTQLSGHGGIQYAGRLFVRALHDSLASPDQLTVHSLVDSNEQLSSLSLASALGARGSRIRFSQATIRSLLSKSWDRIILGHVNLASLLLANRKSNAQVLSLIYGLEAWSRLSRWRRWGLQTSHKILYISEYSRTAAESANPWLARRPSEILYLGLMPDSGSLTDSSVGTGGTSTSPPFALAIGRMSSGERYKGFDELIQVWPEVNRVHPTLRLRIIGNGDDRSRLEQLALSRQAPIDFLGSVTDEVRDANLAACTCFCLPSRGEGFGLVYLEAMRANKAVLAGALDAGREVVADHVAGRVADARKPEQLREALLDVIANGSKFGGAARARFDEHFAYPAFLARFQRLVLGSHSSAQRR